MPFGLPSIYDPMPDVVDAVTAGRIVFSSSADRQVFTQIANGQKVNGRTVRLSWQLANLLVWLADGDVVTILSGGLLRPVKGGPHGVLQTDGEMMVMAVDIAAYAGLRVTLGDRENAIRVITKLISNFPFGKFDLGFPRPVGGANGFNPKQDVFFPVKDQATAQKCFDGTIAMDISQMLEPARSRVRSAIDSTAATFPGCFRTAWITSTFALHRASGDCRSLRHPMVDRDVPHRIIRRLAIEGDRQGIAVGRNCAPSRAKHDSGV
jgi:hypothetical protein